MNDDFEGMWDHIDISDDLSHKKTEELLNSGKEAYWNEDYNHSIESLKGCVNSDPENLEAHYYLGLIYTKKMDFNNAIIHFNEIVMSKHEYVYLERVQSILAYIYTCQEDYSNAKDFLNKVILYDKDNTNILSILGYIHYKEKDYDKAKEYYNKVIKIDDTNANAYNSIGVILIESNENIDEGIDLCKHALKLKPNTPAYLDSIGWGYYKKQDDYSAMEYLKKAFEKAPDSKVIKDHLKDLLDI